MRVLLLPFSWLYGLCVGFRNKLFDWKILSCKSFDVPVISVGNITVGGTGKTPHTEYLIRLLSANRKVAVLSRGYKRKTTGFVLADSRSNSETLGDEPYQMYRKFPNIQIAVDEKRENGISRLLAETIDKRPEVILLDDAFQHRHVKPSLSILLINYNKLIFEDRLLPAGNLREPSKNKSRADMILITKCPERLNDDECRSIIERLQPNLHQSVYFTFFRYGKLIPVFDGYGLQEKTLAEVKNNKTAVLMLVGIASPHELIDELQQYAERLELSLYPDHHRFSEKDLRKVFRTFDAMPENAKLIITTEKDAMRLNDSHNLNPELKKALYYLPVDVGFKSQKESLFKQKIEEHVRNFERNRILA
ncbi:MAG: tetraacyldisaccharide 4'-kinase [Dysgonamonadaceae bacterium]|jgi:tetraacyldisaccharide 4'-kinase|nr:tetraacyldisaccharide 4'-kinase [Dysgonamonadaceae bacterium]